MRTRIGASVRRNFVLILAAGSSVCAVVVYATLSTSDRERIEAVANQACVATERLKEQFRTQAIENYDRLERNAQLLGIEVTPAVRQAALEGRNRTLARFAAREC